MSGQLYHIETTEADHTAMLISTVLAWTGKEADMYLVSEDGCKIYTHRILLSLYSKLVSGILKSFPTDIVGISVSASSVSLAMLLKVLTTGAVIALDEMDLKEVGLAAEVLGVDLKNLNIGFQKKGLKRKTSQVQKKKNAVEIISKIEPSDDDVTNCNMEESIEFVIDGTAEAEYPEDGINLLEVSLSEVVDSPVKKKIKRKSTKSTVDDEDFNLSGEQCKVCRKRFPSKANLDKHMNILHSKEKTIYKCEICEKICPSSSRLSSHKLLHTSEKTFKCEFCDYAALQKGNLKTHKLKRHKETVCRQDDDATVNPLNSIVTGISQ
eukprot:GFUD01000578.1.p1 GENE.GFUD01000578.1~~GFUD01000578.1.p1  ORF type:complete len:324 (+),score=102.93 GFUD01000578.1:51-1022(+)